MVSAMFENIFAEEAPAARSCLVKQEKEDELTQRSCNSKQRCYIAKYNSEQIHRSGELEAGCIGDNSMLKAAHLNEWDTCNLVATTWGKPTQSPFSHFCTCNEDNCNAEVYNYTY